MRRLIHQEDLFRHPAVQLVLANKENFPDDFSVWLKNNIHVWLAFCRQADKIIARGYKHYSARTIIEYMRHHRAITQIDPETDWKLNDHHTPYLARLFGLSYPEHRKIFEFRTTKRVHTPEDFIHEQRN